MKVGGGSVGTFERWHVGIVCAVEGGASFDADLGSECEKQALEAPGGFLAPVPPHGDAGHKNALAADGG